MMAEDCGCRIAASEVGGIGEWRFRIIYCPKHAAAPEMYEALKDLLLEVVPGEYMGMDTKAYDRANALLDRIDKIT